MALKTRFNEATAVTQARTDVPTGVNAPTADIEPVKAIEPVVAPTVAPVEAEKVEPVVVNKQNLLTNIQNTAKDKGEALANDAFIQGVSQYALGRSASADELGAFGTTEFGLKGATVQQVIDRFGIGNDLEGFNIQTPEIPTANNQVTTKEDGTPVTVGNQPDQNKTLDERIDEYQSRVSGIESDKAKEVGLDEKESAALVIKSELDQMKADMDIDSLFDIGDANERADLLDEGIEGLTVSGQLANFSSMKINELINDFNTNESRLSRQKSLDDATDLYKYNTKVVQYNLANGEAQLARDAVSESATAFKEYRAMAIEDMAIQTNMDAIEKADLLQKNEDVWQKEQAGYTPIAKENYEAVVRQYGEERIYTDAYGDSYLKPEDVATTKDGFTLSKGQTRFDANGNIIAAAPDTDADGNTTAPTIKKIGDNNYQWNAELGQWDLLEFAESVDPEQIRKTTAVLSSLAEIEKKILEDNGFSAAVGKSSAIPSLPGTAKREFELDVQNFQSLLTLENLNKMTGVLTDKDIEILRTAATKLSTGMTEDGFKDEVARVKGVLENSIASKAVDGGSFPELTKSYTSLEGLVSENPEYLGIIDKIDSENPGWTDADILQIVNPNFNNVGSDTNTATLDKVSRVPNSSTGGQCGAFVNKLTGIGVGDSFESKMAKMDSSIKTPEPGMVFTMPYSWTGHCGIVVGVDGDNAIVKDSNWSKDESVKTHTIPLSKISGYAKV